MADKKTTEVTTGIDVTLSESQRAKLCAMAPNARPTAALSGLATGLLQDLADGGMMIGARFVSRIASVMKGKAFYGEELVTMVEKGAKRFGQAEVVEMVIDPIWMEPMRQWASVNGRTVQELVQDCMQQAMDAEWFYSMNFERRPLYLTVEKYRELAGALGKEVLSGEDLASAVLESLMKEPELEAVAR